MSRLALFCLLLALLPAISEASFGCNSYVRYSGATTRNSVESCENVGCVHLEGMTSIGLKFEAGGCDIANFCQGQPEIESRTYSRDEWNREFPENGLPEIIQHVQIRGNCCYEEYCS